MKTTDKTLIIDDAVPYAQALFSQFGNVISLPGKDIQAKHVQKADALIVRSRTQVNSDLLKNSNISFVGSTVVGLDHIDQPYLQQRNIEFYSAQGCNANSVAEYVITNIMMLAEQHQFNLSQKSIGIIGVGHVGKLVAHKAKSLGMTILLNDPPRAEAEHDKTFVSLDEALNADIITVHTPLTKNGKFPTYHLISKQQLSNIQPHQIMINAARGGIIDEEEWIKTKTLANIIDCWENEPEINPALYQQAQIATPHIAGHSLDAKIAGSHMVYQALCNFWQQPAQEDWKAALPLPPSLLKTTLTGQPQADILAILNKCYNPQNDDLAIRSKNIIDTHKKYEYYRRHYPTRREWHQHPLKSSGDKTLDNTLYSIGFLDIQ